MILNKRTFYNNTTLNSGSSDKLRNFFGSYYDVSDDGITPNSVINSNNITFSSSFIRIERGKDEFKNDLDWKTYLKGGAYLENRYPGINNYSVFYDFSTMVVNPTSFEDITQIRDDKLKEHIALTNLSDPKLLENMTDRIRTLYNNNLYFKAIYNYHYKNYQQKVSTLEDERLIPNAYLLFGEIDFTLDSHLAKMVSLEGKREDLLSPMNFSQLPDYLNKDFSRHDYSDTTKNEIIERTTNVLFSAEYKSFLKDTNAIVITDDEEYRYSLNGQKLMKTFPYGIELYFEDTSPSTESYVKQKLQQSYFGNRLLLTLKDVFASNTYTPESMLFSKQESFGDSIKNITTSFPLRTIKIDDFFDVSLQNYKMDTSNYTFMTFNEQDKMFAEDNSGKFRFSNTKNINSTYKLIANEITEDPYGATFIFDKLKFTENKSETLAYRIAKFRVSGSTEELITNFWFLDSDEAFEYFDTQVKYNTTYRYKFYQYTFVPGIKYNIEQIVGSRVSNTSDTSFCLEFYDLATDKIVKPIFNPDDSFNFGFNQESTFKYICDVKLNSHQEYRIFEIPMYEKDISVGDHPPNELQVVSVSHDNSTGNKINFMLRNGNFSPSAKEFPISLSAEEEEYRKAYFKNYNLYETDKLPYESRSTPRYAEIYRLDKLPKSYQDFSSEIMKRIDLQYDKDQRPSNVFSFSDKLITNKKYYYVMRTLNENFINGYLTPIYEVEIVDDGGYAYSIVKSYTEDSLPKQDFSTPSTTFTNLLQVQLKENNYVIDDSQADYTKDSSTQKANIKVGDGGANNVWGKKFKFRIISKKTGRKIDLNIAYEKSDN